MRKTYLVGLLAGAAMLAVSGIASAALVTEVGDAGDTIATAQILSGGTDVVTGSLSGNTDADLFGFYWGGGNFYVNSVGSSFDSQLFLFDSAGLGIQGNDDGIAYAGPAYLQVAGLGAGNYFVGMSAYDLDPRTANNSLMFQSYPYQPLYGPATGDPLDHWSGAGYYNAGTYSINFAQITAYGEVIDTNPTGDPVPEPATMLLFGTGVAGLAGARLRKKKNA